MADFGVDDRVEFVDIVSGARVFRGQVVFVHPEHQWLSVRVDELVIMGDDGKKEKRGLRESFVTSVWLEQAKRVKQAYGGHNV